MIIGAFREAFRIYALSNNFIGHLAEEDIGTKPGKSIEAKDISAMTSVVRG